MEVRETKQFQGLLIKFTAVVKSLAGAGRSRLLLRNLPIPSIIVVVVIQWRLDHRQLVKERDRSDRSVAAFKDELDHLEHLAEGLQKQLSLQGGSHLTR